MIFFFLILLIIIYLVYFNRNKHTYFTNTDNYYEFKNNTNHDSFNDEDMGKYRNNNLIEIKKPEININTNPTLTTNFTQIIHEKETYYLLGKAINEYYNINYLIYESPVKYNSVYNYLLVSIIDNKQIIKHTINLRDKININDTIYLSENTFQLGPLLIMSY